MKFALITLGLASFAFGGIITSESSNSNVKAVPVVIGTRIGVTSGSVPAQERPLVRPAFDQNGTSVYGNIRRDQNGQPRGERKELTEAEKAEFEAKRAEFEAKRGENGFGQRGERKELTEAEKAEFEAKRAQFGKNGQNGFGAKRERKELTAEEKADIEAKRAAWSKTEEGQAFEKKFEEWRNSQGKKGGNFTHQSQPLKPAQSTGSSVTKN